MRLTKAASLLLLALLLLALPLGALAEAAQAEETPAPPMAYSRVIDVPGVGEWYYYAQNDPEWNRSLYEAQGSDLYRVFGGAGCGPTALAIALSRQLTPEEMTTLIDHKHPKREGFSYCPCSINYYRCHDRTHEPTYVVTPEEYLHNLPRVLGSYAAGNNDDRHKYRNTFDGTSLSLFKEIAEDYGLDYVGTKDWDTACQALQDGYSIITTVTKGIFTTSSHYIVLAHVDEEWIYILDPWMRVEYELDKKGRLEVIEPGLIRAKKADLRHLGLYGFYMIKKTAQN